MITFLTLELTERCNLRCAHCMVGAEPGRGRDLSLAHIDEALDAARGAGLSMISVSGGEPTLAPKGLRQVFKGASRRGLKVRMVTNGYWATRDAKTLKTLTHWKEAGLTQLSVSADAYHRPWVGLDKVHRIVEQAKACDLPVELNVALARSQETLEVFKEISSWNVPLALTPVSPMGRGQGLDPRTLFMPENVLGCPVVRSPSVDVEGSVQLCCNLTGPLWRARHPPPPFRLSQGGEEPISLGLARHNDGLVDRLERWGPLALLSAVHPELCLSSPCGACMYLAARPELLKTISSLPEARLEAALGEGMTAQSGDYLWAEDLTLWPFVASAHLGLGAAGRAYLGSLRGADGHPEMIFLDEDSAAWIAARRAQGPVFRYQDSPGGRALLLWVQERQRMAILVDCGALRPVGPRRNRCLPVMN